ncbi:MAG: CPBP family intramembrane glutamic endopeptidase [Thermoanaerobaculia bacterium]
MTERMSDRTLLVFLGSLLAATWLLQMLVIRVVGDIGAPDAIPWLLVAMFMPTAWSLLWLHGRQARWHSVPWRAGRLRFLVVGALVPAALALVALASIVSLGWGTSSYFAFSGWTVNVLKGPWLVGAGSQVWFVFLVNFALTSLAYAGLNGAAAVGEEFGWRGLIQGQLLARFGVEKEVLFLGLVWACWHLPANIAGYNFAANPLLGASSSSC